MSRSPWLARRLLGTALPARVRTEVLGDLEEGFAARTRLGGRARLWYWRNALAFAFRLRAEWTRGGLRAGTPLLRSLADDAVSDSPPVSTHVENLLHDFRFAVRTLLRAPMFAIVAIVTLALAVGANAALFSLVNGVLLAPLPYEDPDELVNVWTALSARNVDRFLSSFPILDEIRTTVDSFERVGGIFSSLNGIAGEGQEPEQLWVGWVTWDFLPLLGVQPLAGRLFNETDALPGGTQIELGNQTIAEPRVALLSHSAWQARYAGDVSALGEEILLDGRPLEIVGVLPPGFRMHLPPAAGIPAEHDVMVVLRPDYGTAPLIDVLLNVVGRLREGATLEQARGELVQVRDELIERSELLRTAGLEIRSAPFDADLVAASRPALLALMGAVGFVLLIACANVSTLLLVRATARQREMAVRAALGGSRRRLIHQMIIESLVLGLLGGGLGITLAAFALKPLLALQPADLPRAEGVTLDLTVLAFSLAVSVGAALLFGILPALQSSRPQVVESLKLRVGTGDRRQRWTRNGVVLAQVALSIMLLVGAGLMVRSFANLLSADPGFEPRGVLKVVVDVPAGRYPDPGQRHAMLLRMQERFAAIPGVSSVSSTIPIPLNNPIFWGRYGTEEALADPSLFRQANYRVVLPDYIETMGARLVAGRALDRADFVDGARYVMVDTILAERTWPGESPIGKQLYVRPATPEPIAYEVVGLVQHEHPATLAEPGPEAVYFLTSAMPLDLPDFWLLRTDLADPTTLVGEIRSAVNEFDPLIPVADVETMEAIVAESLGGPRGALMLIGLFGAIATTMAAVGLYGVIAYSVRQRSAEMGIRMALGARAVDIRSMVVGQGVKLAGAGVVLGLVGALALTRTIAALLTGVSPTDPLTFAATALLFLAIAAFAAWVPARRATRIDPLKALADG